MYFDGFIEWFNNEIGSEELAGPVHLDLDFSFERHFVHERQASGVRMSSLGKPAIVTALQKLGYYEPEPRGKLRYIFFLGDVFENVLGELMKSYGYKVLTDQTKHPEDTYVEWNGLGGHYDFTVEVDGQPILVEAKTMSGNYARTFRNYPNDDRGYMTQLGLYTAATGLPGAWICMDKSTGEIFEVVPDSFDATLDRAGKVLDRLEHVSTVEDVFNYFRPPPGKQEIYQKQPSGKLLVPQSMAWSSYKTAVYRLTQEPNGYGKMTDYIEDAADAEFAEIELDYLVETGVLCKEDV